MPIPTISIHALREEGDPSSSPLAIASANFYPRPPRGGRHRHCTRGHRPRNFYPRPPRGGRPREQIPLWMPARISIHALREEGDVTDCYTRIKDGQFLSTPSARRATNYRHLILAAQNISIHALREEGDIGIVLEATGLEISIHALREEGDPESRYRSGCPPEFLSTPSARRATFPFAPPHPGGDNFYPRPPRGGRRTTAVCSQKVSRFLSTPSARRATKYKCRRRHKHQYFYPRPPRGGRQHLDCAFFGLCDFYPRPPRGGRQRARQSGKLLVLISIHALREEGDIISEIRKPVYRKFLSTPSARRATAGYIPCGSA